MDFPFAIELRHLQDIAEQRAEALSWKKIAEDFPVDAKRLQRLVEKEPTWERFLSDARQEMFAAAATEGVMMLRTELRSDDAKARIAAAAKLMNLKPPRSAPKSKKDEPPRMTKEAEYWIERDKSFALMGNEEFSQIVVRDVQKFVEMGRISASIVRKMADDLPKDDGESVLVPEPRVDDAADVESYEECRATPLVGAEEHEGASQDMTKRRRSPGIAPRSSEGHPPTHRCPLLR